MNYKKIINKPVSIYNAYDLYSCNDYKDIFNETCVECGSFQYVLICMCYAAPHRFNPDEVCPECTNSFLE